MKLKDFRELEKDVEYKFDNVHVVYDGESLYSRYSFEKMWHPFSEGESFFKKCEEKGLEKVY